MILIYLCLGNDLERCIEDSLWDFSWFHCIFRAELDFIAKRSQKTIGLLQMQIGNVVETLERWESFNNGIPDQDLPQLHFLSANEYASLSLQLRRIAYDLDNSLRVAEGFNNQG
jgi:hypothetical protein